VDFVTVDSIKITHIDSHSVVIFLNTKWQQA
jgi:hypothetical protein